MYKIYCDMDGVLVNFLGGTKRIMGREFNDPTLGTEQQKWAILYDVPQFWLSLGWMPNAQTLWNYIKHHDTYILSACPPLEDNPFCPSEKKEWCRIHLGIEIDRVYTVERSQKKDFATMDGIPNILIDDHPKNITEWKEAGGIAVHHHTVTETLEALRQLGV